MVWMYVFISSLRWGKIRCFRMYVFVLHWSLETENPRFPQRFSVYISMLKISTAKCAGECFRPAGAPPHAACALLKSFKQKEDTSSTQGSKFNLCWPKKSSNNNLQSWREDTDELCLVYFSCCALLTVLFTYLSVSRVLKTSVVFCFFLFFISPPYLTMNSNEISSSLNTNNIQSVFWFMRNPKILS